MTVRPFPFKLRSLESNSGILSRATDFCTEPLDRIETKRILVFFLLRHADVTPFVIITIVCSVSCSSCDVYSHRLPPVAYLEAK
jgi:hypothetical protein